MLLIEGKPFVVAWLDGMNNIRTEDGSQPLRPPFVQVINGPINLFAPTLLLRKTANLNVWIRHWITASLTLVKGCDFSLQALNLCSVPADGLGSVLILMSLL